MEQDLIVKDLHVQVDGTEVLKGVDLTIKAGEVHAIMGPNGSGKSTLSLTIMGHPSYTVTKGSITYGGKDLLSMKPDERARLGLFLSFQYPAEVEGVTLASFLRKIYSAKSGTEVKITDFTKIMREKMSSLKMDPKFVRRYLNAGFSGGEKKRCEILQLAILEPTLAILDETDSGLDVDALQIVSEGVNALRGKMSILMITHYNRILRHIAPDKVHVFSGGRIVKTGDASLANELEESGYDKYVEAS